MNEYTQATPTSIHRHMLDLSSYEKGLSGAITAHSVFFDGTGRPFGFGKGETSAFL